MRISDVLVQRDGITIGEAEEMVQDLADRLVADGDLSYTTVEEALREEFGLEPDYILDLMSYFN